MDTKLRKSRTLLEANRITGRLFQPEVRLPGSILSFVPAHGGSSAGAVAEELSRTMGEALGVAVLLADFERRGLSPWQTSQALSPMDGRAWGALVSEVDGVDVLHAREVHPRRLRQLVEYAREYYAAVCADLSSANQSSALEVFQASDGIFLVANSDSASLRKVREKAEWLRSIGLGGRCGLLLKRDPKGVHPWEAEELTGVPVCSFIDANEELAQLAGWLASANRPAATGPQFEYALAV